jgi:hypothetical protein
VDSAALMGEGGAVRLVAGDELQGWTLKLVCQDDQRGGGGRAGRLVFKEVVGKAGRLPLLEGRRVEPGSPREGRKWDREAFPSNSV